MKRTVLSCLAGVVALAAVAGETVFDFTKGKTFFNPSVQEQNRGVKTVMEKEGLMQSFPKTPGRSSISAAVNWQNRTGPDMTIWSST